MPTGIQIINDSGSVQISTDMKNPVLKASGNLTTVTNDISGAPLVTSKATFSYTRPSTSHHPILAIRPTGRTFLLGIDGHTGLNWTWTFLSAQAVGTTIPYWLFDKDEALPASGLFEIYDASGNRFFNLNSKPMRIRDILTGTAGSILAQSNTYDAGRTYAASINRWAEHKIYRALPNNTDLYGIGVAGITDGMQTQALRFATTPGDDTGVIYGERSILVIDVTNY